MLIVVGGFVFILAGSPARAQAAYKVGVTQREFLRGDIAFDWRGAKTHGLVTTVWYPADARATETAQWVGDPPNAMASAGKAAPDAALAPSPTRFPLILLSHGTGGSALMMAWLGTRLAANGFIAAAVNHPGNNALEPYTVQGFTLGWERAADLSQVLRGMLGDKEFGPRIDPARVGAAGFSFGGYATMVLAGAAANPISLADLEKLCAAGSRSIRCTSPPEFPDLTEKASALARSDPEYARALNEAAISHRDPHVRAVFAIAPVDIDLSEKSLEQISIPVEIVAGAGDPIAVPAENAHVLAQAIAGAKLTIYPGGVGHYTFLDTCTPWGREHMPGFCVDQAGVDRESVHAETARKAVAFFDKALNR
jgi:predicted dienelactone hydrolase